MLAFPRWFMQWRRKASPTDSAPLGLTTQELDALAYLRALPQWKHYQHVLERLGEQQATELASGLVHDRYMFVCGALTTLRRVSTVVDDLLAASASLKEITDARSRDVAVRTARHAATYLNTPWYDGAGKPGRG